MHAFDIRHTEDSLRRLYRQWWRRRFGRAHLVAIFAVGITFFYMLLMRAAPWPAVTLATLAIAYAAFLTSVRDTATLLALKHFEVLGPMPLHYEFDDESFQEQTSIGRVQFAWTAFDSLTEADGVLSLWRKPRQAEQFVAFPLDQIPPGAATFLRQRMAFANPRDTAPRDVG